MGQGAGGRPARGGFPPYMGPGPVGVDDGRGRPAEGSGGVVPAREHRRGGRPRDRLPRLRDGDGRRPRRGGPARGRPELPHVRAPLPRERGSRTGHAAGRGQGQRRAEAVHAPPDGGAGGPHGEPDRRRLRRAAPARLAAGGRPAQVPAHQGRRGRGRHDPRVRRPRGVPRRQGPRRGRQRPADHRGGEDGVRQEEDGQPGEDRLPAGRRRRRRGRRRRGRRPVPLQPGAAPGAAGDHLGQDRVRAEQEEGVGPVPGGVHRRRPPGATTSPS